MTQICVSDCKNFGFVHGFDFHRRLSWRLLLAGLAMFGTANSLMSDISVFSTSAKYDTVQWPWYGGDDVHGAGRISLWFTEELTFHGRSDVSLFVMGLHYVGHFWYTPTSYVITMVADVLAQNRHQPLSNHHADSIMIILSHESHCVTPISMSQP